MSHSAFVLPLRWDSLFQPGFEWCLSCWSHSLNASSFVAEFVLVQALDSLSLTNWCFFWLCFESTVCEWVWLSRCCFRLEEATLCLRGCCFSRQSFGRLVFILDFDCDEIQLLSLFNNRLLLFYLFSADRSIRKRIAFRLFERRLAI
jgi:hypothetical protein